MDSDKRVHKHVPRDVTVRKPKTVKPQSVKTDKLTAGERL